MAMDINRACSYLFPCVHKKSPPSLATCYVPSRPQSNGTEGACNIIPSIWQAIWRLRLAGFATNIAKEVGFLPLHGEQQRLPARLQVPPSGSDLSGLDLKITSFRYMLWLSIALVSPWQAPNVKKKILEGNVLQKTEFACLFRTTTTTPQMLK